MTRSFHILVATGLWVCNLSFAQIIKNGSFETASVDPGTGWRGLPKESKAIDGWVVSSGNIDYIGTYWTASDSDRSVELNGNTAGSVSQSFKTSKNFVYQMQFDMAGNPDGGRSPKKLRVTVADSSWEFTFTPVNRDSMGWKVMPFKFTAIDSVTTLTFTSLTSGAYGPVIDKVRGDTVTFVREIAADRSLSFELNQNFPNPFNPSTTISFDLPRASEVTLKIFDLVGHEVATLAEQKMQAGRYNFKWDASGMPGGVYFYRLQTEAFTQTRKLLLLR